MDVRWLSDGCREDALAAWRRLVDRSGGDYLTWRGCRRAGHAGVGPLDSLDAVRDLCASRAPAGELARSVAAAPTLVDLLMTRLGAGCALGLALVLAGCASAPASAREDACATRAVGDPLTPRFLEGTWALELRVTARELRYQPASQPFPAAILVHGTMAFDVRVPEAQRDSALAWAAPFRGSLHARLDSLLARTPPGWVDGTVPFVHHSLGTPAGAFGLLVGSDTCADCGHLVFRGIRQADIVCGIWRQTFLGTGDRGTFVLRRVTRSAKAAA